MSLIDTGVEIYYTLFKVTILFSFLFTIFNSVFAFVDLSSIPQINWSIINLNSAVSSLSNASGLDLAVAIPMLIVSIFSLLIQAFINSILFINYLIYNIVYLISIILLLPNSTSIILSNIISWIIILPALIGVISDIGRLIFYLLFGKR